MATRKKSKKSKKDNDQHLEDTSHHLSSSVQKVKPKLARWMAVENCPGSRGDKYDLKVINKHYWRIANIVSSKCLWAGTNWSSGDQDDTFSLMYFSQPCNLDKFIDMCDGDRAIHGTCNVYAVTRNSEMPIQYRVRDLCCLGDTMVASGVITGVPYISKALRDPSPDAQPDAP